MNYYIILIALAGSLGGLLAGYDMGVISGALLFIKKTWQISAAGQGFLVSSAIIGCLIGALSNGFLSDLFGRKKIIIATSILFLAGSVLSSISPSLEILIFSRIIIGAAVGIASFAVPLYLSEIAPMKHRGAFISLFQLSLTFGILFAYLINALFAKSAYNWRLMLFAGVIPSLILFFAMLFLKDSPRWLLLKGKDDEAQEICTLLGIEDEICEIKKTISKNEKFEFKKWYITPLLLGIGIMFAQICSGINTIIYYTPTIFQFLGFKSEFTAIIASVGVGSVNFLMTFVAIFLSDKIGRKPLVYIGLFIMMSSMLLLSFMFLNQAAFNENIKIFGFLSIMAYICAFSFSLGPITYILISEIFPLRARGFLMSVSLSFNFIFNFIVVLTFLPLVEKINEGRTFLIYAIVCFISILFYKFFIPETKGVSLEKIEEKFRGEN